MNALALFSASVAVPFYANFLKSDSKRANHDLTAVTLFVAVGMLVTVMALIDDQMGLTAWFGFAVPQFEMVG
jgi:hypothetical protein